MDVDEDLEIEGWVRMIERCEDGVVLCSGEEIWRGLDQEKKLMRKEH